VRKIRAVQLNEFTGLLQPAGSAVKLLVNCSAVAGRASSVVNVTVTAWVPLPVCVPSLTTALIWPVGDAVPTTLSLVVPA
jgi:hypothetical protein